MFGVVSETDESKDFIVYMDSKRRTKVPLSNVVQKKMYSSGTIENEINLKRSMLVHLMSSLILLRNTKH